MVNDRKTLHVWCGGVTKQDEPLIRGWICFSANSLLQLFVHAPSWLRQTPDVVEVSSPQWVMTQVITLMPNG